MMKPQNRCFSVSVYRRAVRLGHLAILTMTGLGCLMVDVAFAESETTQESDSDREVQWTKPYALITKDKIPIKVTVRYAGRMPHAQDGGVNPIQQIQRELDARLTTWVAAHLEVDEWARGYFKLKEYPDANGAYWSKDIALEKAVMRSIEAAIQDGITEIQSSAYAAQPVPLRDLEATVISIRIAEEDSLNTRKCHLERMTAWKRRRRAHFNEISRRVPTPREQNLKTYEEEARAPDRRVFEECSRALNTVEPIKSSPNHTTPIAPL